jgi:hypothetical protein
VDKANKTRQGLGLGLTVVIVAVAVAVWLGRPESAGPSLSRRTGSVAPPGSTFVGGVGPGFGQRGSPFAFGQSMSLSDAQAKVGFNIPRPDDQLASDSQIKTVWVDTSSGAAQAQIELEYTSGLTVALEPALKDLIQSDAAQLTFFKQQVADDTAQTNGAESVSSVNGHPALVVPQNSAVWANGQSQGNSGDIEFVVGGEVIDVVGHFGTDDLQRVATSVSARPA